MVEATRVIQSVEDLEGFQDVEEQDQSLLQRIIAGTEVGCSALPWCRGRICGRPASRGQGSEVLRILRRAALRGG